MRLEVDFSAGKVIPGYGEVGELDASEGMVWRLRIKTVEARREIALGLGDAVFVDVREYEQSPLPLLEEQPATRDPQDAAVWTVDLAADSPRLRELFQRRGAHVEVFVRLILRRPDSLVRRVCRLRVQISREYF